MHAVAPRAGAITPARRVATAFMLAVTCSATALAQSLVITNQGARPFGGKIVGEASTGSLHCDHGYVEWQIPRNPRRTPIVMVHASSTKTWDTTFDGRDGFRNIFLGRGFQVYMTDLPRTGRAGQGCATTTYTPRPDNDQASFTTWRLGLWLPGDPTPDFYPGVQFPKSPGALNEFLRIQYPEFNAPENEQVETDALAVLLDEIGPAVVLTHSSTGIRGGLRPPRPRRSPRLCPMSRETSCSPRARCPHPWREWTEP